jgi:hypothetical protein
MNYWRSAPSVSMPRSYHACRKAADAKAREARGHLLAALPIEV